MTTRDTGTGKVLELMIEPALRQGGYSWKRQVRIGLRPGGGRHLIDVLAQDAEGRAYLVSLKWQQTSGTAEQKVPFEVICLAEAIISSEGKFKRAYLVLGGGGWTLREFFTGGGLDRHLRSTGDVRIVTLEDFVAIANNGAL